MQVGNLLTAPFPAVYHYPVAVPGNSFPLRQFARSGDHLRDQRPVFRRQLIQTGDVLQRHDEQMGRGLRIDIPESGYPLVPVEYFARYLAGDDITKNTHRSRPLFNLAGFDLGDELVLPLDVVQGLQLERGGRRFQPVLPFQEAQPGYGVEGGDQDVADIL